MRLDNAMNRQEGRRLPGLPKWLEHLPWWWMVVRRLLMVSSLALAMYQFVLIDPSLIGFAVVWTLPPILVIALDLFMPMRTFARRVVLIYLLLVPFGTWLSANPGILPSMGGLHPGATEFAEKWNQLDAASRRLIAWNMGLTACLLFWFIGYAAGWVPLTQRHLPTGISPQTAGLAVGVCWGLPLLTLLGWLSMALVP